MPKAIQSDCDVTLQNEQHNGRNVQIVRYKKPAKTKFATGRRILNEKFIPPDGGWGWMVATAAGISLLSSFPILQQFGILFRQRFTDLGWRSSHIVTLINAQQSASTVVGIFSEKLYRRISYRLVSLMGAVLIFLGLLATLWSESFISYFFAITILYGFGKGFVFSASTVAVNSYFTTKRKSAMTVMGTIAGLGPMFLPYLSTFLMVQYGITGSILLYAGFSLHNFIGALIYQPVQWHEKKLKGERLSENLRILHPKTDLTLQGNEKLNGSTVNLDLKHLNHHQLTSTPDKNDTFTLVCSKKEANGTSGKLELSPEEIKLLQIPREEFIKNEHRNQSFSNKIFNHLHLDLLKNFTYFNLALGLTVIEFTENNFASVLPFILNEFKFSNIEIAISMSILGSCDMIMKFLIPYTVAKLKCDKRVIMIVSCMLICAARVVVGQSRKVPIALVCFGVMGTNKAIRVAYGNMILPGYMPPKRLKDAIALERTIMGVFSLTFAPIIGLIPDATSYGFFVLSMNGMCVIVAILWFSEDLVRWCYRKLRKSPLEAETKTVGV